MSDPGYEPTQVDLPAVQPGTGGAPPPPGGPTPPPPGPPPPPDRRPWIIGGLVALIVLLVIALLLLGGDDDGDDTAGDTTTSSTTSSSTTSSTTTSSTSSTTTSTTAPPATTTTTTNVPPSTADPDECREEGQDPEAPEPAAEAVFDAWTRGDVACASELMTDDALDELFSRSGAGATDVFQGCFEVDEPDPAIDCAFTYPGGSTHYLMNFSDTDGWQVFDVFQVAD
jgi:hypothetical protein